MKSKQTLNFIKNNAGLLLHLASRYILYEPYRAFFICFSIAAVISVILVIDGFQQGLYLQLRNVVVNRNADLILTQAGISNMIAARSIIPQHTRLDVEAIKGVREAHPLTGISAIYEKNGRRNPVFVLVYDTKGGPIQLEQGTPISKSHQIIIDHSLAALYGLKPGDTFILSDYKFKIAGISSGAVALFTPFAFMKYDDLLDYYMESDIAADISTFPLLSFLLVDLDDKEDPLVVAKRIEQAVPSVDVFTPEALANNDVKLGRELFGPIMNLLLMVSYIIGLLSVGMVIFTNTYTRTRSLALIRALGAPIEMVAGFITLETAFLILLSFPVAIVIALLLAHLIPRFAPIYLILPTEPVTLIRTFTACILFSLAGALMAMRLTAKVEPDIAFRYA